MKRKLSREMTIVLQTRRCRPAVCVSGVISIERIAPAQQQYHAMARRSAREIWGRSCLARLQGECATLVAWSNPGWKLETNLKLLWSTVRCRKRRRQHGTIRPEGGLLEVEGCQRAAVRKLQEPARGIVGERQSRSGEIVEVDRVASTKILELRAKIRRSANPRSEQRRVVDH
jgi:hypothetical protein